MKLRQTLEGHEGQVLCARFGPQGKRVVTGGRDRQVMVWSLRGGKHERTLVGHERAVSALHFTPAEELVSGDVGGVVRVWSWPRGKLSLELEGHDAAVLTLGSSADGSLIASGSRDETICIWMRETGELLHRLPVGPRGMSFVFSGDDEYLVSGRSGDTLCFWSLETGELAWEQDAGPGMVGAFELGRTREWAVSRGWRGPVTLWSTLTWSYAAVLPIIEKGLSGATLRPEHEQVVCAYESGVAVYDGATGRQLESFELPCKGVYDLDVSPDGRFVVTASADELARVLEIEDLEPEPDEVEEAEKEEEEEEEEE